MNLRYYSILLGSLILLLGIGVIWRIALRFRRSMGLEKEEREKVQESAFIISAFHQVTKELKDKEKELKRLKSIAEQRADNVESYNENILQCVTSGVVTFDRNCVLTTINRAAEEMLKITRQEAMGRSCSEIFQDAPICNAVRDTISQKTVSLRLETALERPAGKLWLGFNTAVLTDRQGDALGVILSFSDLTEVKRLQEQMELRDRLTALGEMSAGIAHELRNPMAVISGYLNLLAKKTGDQVQPIISDITAEINGMNRIIGDMLTFARPASLNRVRINIREMVEGCMAAVLQATGAESRIRVSLDIPPVELLIDEVLMRQAFSNLVQNAIEAMPDGGTLSVKSKKTAKDLVLELTDTGPGIPPETVRKIFLPFFTTKDRGVGLGLALVHKIILSHGGRVEVSGSEVKGATFTVTLPR